MARRNRSLALVVGLSAIVLAGACSSSNKQYAPAASNDCNAPPCPGGNVIGGKGTGGSGSGGEPSVTPEAGLGSNFGDCSTDPALCTIAGACPSLQLNGNLQGCGFVPPGIGTFQMACDCGTLLCPITLGASCAQLPGLIADKTLADICNQPVTNCRNIAAGGCDPDCKTACSGNPACISFCGC